MNSIETRRERSQGEINSLCMFVLLGLQELVYYTAVCNKYVSDTLGLQLVDKNAIVDYLKVFIIKLR